MSASPIGFIGLGQMGFRMARNLVKSGRAVVVHDVVPGRGHELGTGLSSPVTVASSPKLVAQQVDTVITMLPSSKEVREVYFGAHGVLAGARPGSLLIDSSTVEPSTSRAVADASAAAGMSMVDAPVSGGTGGAENATLTFMVGGTAESFSRASPLLQLLGRNVVHCGSNGTGSVAKICNNLVLAVCMAGVSEGLLLGRELGIDPKVLTAIFNSSSARCWSSDVYNPCPGVMQNVPSANNFAPGFAATLMVKDVALALSSAGEVKQALPMTALAHQLYTLVAASSPSPRDFSAIFELLSKPSKS